MTKNYLKRKLQEFIKKYNLLIAEQHILEDFIRWLYENKKKG